MLTVPDSVAELPLNTPFHYDGSRLETPFKRIFLAANAALLALRAARPEVAFPEYGAATMNGAALDLTVDFPSPQLFLAAVAGADLVPHLWLRLNKRWVDKLPPDNGDPEGPLDPMQGVIEDGIKAQFILLYEDHWPFVWQKANTNRDNLEPIWAFARVVRNAVGHGRVNIDDKTFPPVTWHGVTFGRDQNLQPLFSRGFGAPDLILLMLDMHFALVRLGA